MLDSLGLHPAMFCYCVLLLRPVTVTQHGWPQVLSAHLAPKARDISMRRGWTGSVNGGFIDSCPHHDQEAPGVRGLLLSPVGSWAVLQRVPGAHGRPVPSAQLREYARGIALAESRLYPQCVRFEGAMVKLSTPGASPGDLRGQFSRVGLEDVPGVKMRGLMKMGEDEVLAFPPVTAVYIRHAQHGRNGRLLMPHALTTTEWNLFTQKQVLPPRFQRPSDTAQTLFSDELIAAIREANGAYVMPGAEGDTERSLRKIRNFFFDGFDVASLRKRKKKPGSSAARSATHPARAKVPTEGKEGVVYLLRAGPFFKIGKSTVFEKRLGQIKLQLPHAVEVVHVIQAAHPSQAEAQWHGRFAARRLNGEWFELSEAEVAEFKSVSQM